MNYFISEDDKKLRAEKLAKFLIGFKYKLSNPNFRTNHNLNRWKFYKNKCNKTLSSLGYKLNLETKELRELIPMKIKAIDLDKEALTNAMEHLEMSRRKYRNAKEEMTKAKDYYNVLLKSYMDKKENYEKRN